MPGGSSPLARGKQRRRIPARGRRGLIPARAGKTPRTPQPRTRPGAHPRSRGENGELAALPREGCGSSPLARGKPRHKRCPTAACTAHPRSRGENGVFGVECVYDKGSSPLARGKLEAFGGLPLASRLIPARAGKTSWRPERPPDGTAHPRSRGENSAGTAGYSSQPGSSPLARGKRGSSPGWRRTTGLIPARAGKTPTRALRPRSVKAHPRSRGENGWGWDRGQGEHGSSPLARGKLPVRNHASRIHGLIPARAGKTAWGRSSVHTDWAHPRSRGENATPRQETIRRCGSSPLARGKQISGIKFVLAIGLIPARAGKTLRDLRFCHADRSDLGNP